MPRYMYVQAGTRRPQRPERSQTASVIHIHTSNCVILAAKKRGRIAVDRLPGVRRRAESGDIFTMMQPPGGHPPRNDQQAA